MSDTTQTPTQSGSGHPEGLFTLFFSEMWERFCYYGMRVLLTLYLIKSLLKGDAEASLIYGAYTGLVYAAPILGGKMADMFLGYRFAVILGGILMAIGEFLILGGNETMLLVGMGALIVGNGYFKANISTIVGKLYKDGDPKRDSGFTIFYIGINIGALLATTVVAYVGETYGFDKGFALAGFGMLTGILIFWAGRQKYSAAPGLEFTEAGKQKVVGPLNRIQLVSIASLGLIPACYFLILNNSLLNYIFLGLFVYVAYVLLSAGIKEDKAEGTSIWKDRMIALLLFMVINIVFWACFEQAGTSLTLFADRNVDRAIFGWEMPASMTQFFNPAFIIIFGSIFSVMWIKLSKIGKNPSIPMKFALGIFQLGLGFLVTYVGFTMETDNMVPLLTLVILYMLHTTGELFLSPIGLSMVTKLSPKKIAGTAMGAWFLSFAIANFLGGRIAALTGGGHGGGPESDGTTFSAETTVKDAFGMMGAPEDFEAWPALAEGISQDDDVAKNTNYQNWSDIRDWVLLRESLTEQVSLEAWVGARTAQKEFTSADSWLDRATWDDLSGRYTAIVTDDNAKKEDDDEATEAGLGFKDWLYFRNGIENLEVEASSPLAAALDVQIDTVQETRLNKYVHIFSIIGIVLVGISILIALISKPLQKLMHGVE